MKLGHITIRTAFFDEEIAFYKDIAGLKIVRDLRKLGSDIVFMADLGGDTRIEIIKTPGAESSGNDAISIGFHTKDAETLQNRLQENGLAVSPMTSPAPPVRFFFVKDPAGVNVQFVEEKQELEPKFTNVLHLGIVVRDIQKSAEFYEKELGIGPWKIDECNNFFRNIKVNDGYGLPILSSICKSTGYEIELIQPVGPCVYQDWLDEHGPGMHHAILKTDEAYDDIVALGEKYSDHSHYMDASWPNGEPLVSYVDMRDTMGMILEISPMPQGYEPPEGPPPFDMP